MSRIFITGSSDGLGQLAARQLVSEGHQVVLHARTQARGEEAHHQVPEAETVLIGDLSSIDETKKLAADANTIGYFDVIIHNAGVYEVPRETIFKVNSLAPYILTCMIKKPKRLIYMSSGMHTAGNPSFTDYDPVNTSYPTSKLHNVIMTIAVARSWPDVYANAVDPGWVPTKMGGANATGDLHKGYETQVWLAVSDDLEARVSGNYFFHKQVKPHRSEADDKVVQDAFLALCEKMTGVRFRQQ